MAYVAGDIALCYQQHCGPPLQKARGAPTFRYGKETTERGEGWATRPQVSETTVTRADAPKALEYNWGGFDMRWEL
jgi:hypothetical protein